MDTRRNTALFFAAYFLEGLCFYAPVATLYRQAAGLTLAQMGVDDVLDVLNEVESVANWTADATDQGLKDLHASFVTIKGGSANSIKAALQNLYNAVESWATGTEGQNKTVATAIRTAITNDGTFSKSGDAAPYTLTTTLTYPQNMNLPDGAVELAYDGNAKKFSYATPSGNIMGASNAIDPNNICYPASLYYFVKTDLAANDGAEVTWPTTTTGWTANTAPWLASNTSWYDEVKATTRTIALKKNIQYAVANLKLSVACTSSTLPDKESDQGTVNYVPANFPVTAVLIGGQPDKVDWQFGPLTGTTTTSYNKTVYDKVTGINATTGTPTTFNYTLLLPNNVEGNTQNEVYFAIELTNNTAQDFLGADGVIPAGGTFYLVGKLDPDDSTQGVVSNPGSIQNPSVFMSDYQTTVNAKISTLENAYNTIPDLRATNMQLGLSVDLEWQAGLTFNVSIGE